MAIFTTARQAVQLIEDHATVGMGGFGAYCSPDALFAALAERYAETQHPAHLTAVAGISPGDNSKDDVGLNHLVAPGLIDTILAGHLANPPKIAELVGSNQIAGYAIPLGVMMHLFRAIAGNKPGVLTHVGLGTYADPRIEGCKVNDLARGQGRDVVELLPTGGEDCLLYHSFPIQVCLIRGTYADEDGNISMAHEALTGGELELAGAVHNSGGKVIVQVEEIVQRGTLHPKTVRIHGALVDYVVKAAPEYHRQGYASACYRPELSGEVRCLTDALPPMALDLRKVIARRGALELKPGIVINLGIGIPAGVGNVANEEGIAPQTTLSLESGPMGGVPLAGGGFAGAMNPEAIHSICDTFDLYDGGLLDMTFLGAAEIDARGNVNVSKFGTRCTGPGGFINISQNTPKVCFMGAFTAGKCDIEVSDGALHIKSDGPGVKFTQTVQQITFSADYARKTGQEVLYLTERAVFRLTGDGIMLTELAPGVDLERDVLAHMAFRPLISNQVKTMDTRIFRQEKMGLQF